MATGLRNCETEGKADTVLNTWRKSPVQLAASDQVRSWTRARFGLGCDDVVMVTEIRCQLPGCPPLETIVAFWEAADETRRYHFKIFKPVAEVVEADLPPSWLKPGLVDDGMGGCECC
ncbi:MAG: hypothetical protein AB7O43_08090 [Hyphomicrobiaceae bacterium]